MAKIFEKLATITHIPGKPLFLGYDIRNDVLVTGPYTNTDKAAVANLKTGQVKYSESLSKETGDNYFYAGACWISDDEYALTGWNRGFIDFISVSTGKITKSTKVGKEKSAMVRAKEHFLVTCGSLDEIAIIDTRNDTVRKITGLHRKGGRFLADIDVMPDGRVICSPRKTNRNVIIDPATGRATFGPTSLGCINGESLNGRMLNDTIHWRTDRDDGSSKIVLTNTVTNELEYIYTGDHQSSLVFEHKNYLVSIPGNGNDTILLIDRKELFQFKMPNNFIFPWCWASHRMSDGRAIISANAGGDIFAVDIDEFIRQNSHGHYAKPLTAITESNRYQTPDFFGNTPEKHEVMNVVFNYNPMPVLNGKWLYRANGIDRVYHGEIQDKVPYKIANNCIVNDWDLRSNPMRNINLKDKIYNVTAIELPTYTGTTSSCLVNDREVFINTRSGTATEFYIYNYVTNAVRPIPKPKGKKYTHHGLVRIDDTTVVATPYVLDNLEWKESTPCLTINTETGVIKESNKLVRKTNTGGAIKLGDAIYFAYLQPIDKKYKMIKFDIKTNVMAEVGELPATGWGGTLVGETIFYKSYKNAITYNTETNKGVGKSMSGYNAGIYAGVTRLPDGNLFTSSYTTKNVDIIDPVSFDIVKEFTPPGSTLGNIALPDGNVYTIGYDSYSSGGFVGDVIINPNDGTTKIVDVSQGSYWGILLPNGKIFRNPNQRNKLIQLVDVKQPTAIEHLLGKQSN